MVFKGLSAQYSELLLQRVKTVFEFAEKYQGSYNDSLGPWVCPFYRDFSGYEVNCILGKNPMNMSYMVGYGGKFTSSKLSLPSTDQHPEHIECKGETPYFSSNNSNPNLLTGAVVGGPYVNDTYDDSRADFAHSEPTTYINAPLVGLLAYFKAFSTS
ncbi:hypothetical protein RJ639_013953 [Escallonia herrerae]|uniref:Endoglucanase n=1 Tax=Escallonia herrerae TaxID=1293975 RepID=A0AA88VLY1_9ASTE|nr:hypothetical protein RJ639_013953 [Escallonia herrerae]